MCIPSCGYQNEFLADCGQHQVRQLAATDCTRTFYYEKTSGALVALFSFCAPWGPVCDFGPPGFTQPAACSPWAQVYPCDDGGADGGTE